MKIRKWLGKAWQGMAGLCMAAHGWARQGDARQGNRAARVRFLCSPPNPAWHRQAWLGRARRGTAGQGKVWRRLVLPERQRR